MKSLVSFAPAFCCWRAAPRRKREARPFTKTTISLGTATPGGGFPLYGNAFAEVMNAADPTLSIEPRNTKGSNENIPLLEAGQLDIALVAGEPSYEAFMGIGRPRDPPENPDRDVFQPRHVRGARRQPLQDHSRSRRQAGRVRRQGLGPADPVALHARRPRAEAGRGFQVDLSRPRRRRPGDGAGRTGRGAVGRRHRLARIYRGGGKPRRRPLHRARRRARSRASAPSTVFSSR